MNRSSGSAGALAILGSAALVAAIVGMLALDSWWTFAIAILLLIAGVFALTRFVQALGWTPRSGRRIEGGLKGMHEDLSISDEVHDELSPHDVPPDNPAHHELEPAAERVPARGGTASRG